MHDSYVPYKVFQKGRLKVGVLGLSIELNGLVEQKNYKKTRYLNPVIKGNEVASLLKNELNCDLVVCLSDLGYDYKERKISDRTLAQNTRNIDLIIGGYTHTFMDRPEDVRNRDGGITTINQVGWAGINLGRIAYTFGRGRLKSKRLHSIWLRTNYRC